MIAEKRSSLRPILESSDGIHLTAYLVNRGDVANLKLQLRETLREAYQWLMPVLTIEERKKFLEPIRLLLNDARIFKDMKGNIGLFRSKDSFRILNIPVDVVRQCHVASTFHVKPLLRWMQADREFLILGLTPNSAHLYFGSQTSFQKVGAIYFREQDEIFAWIGDWLIEKTQDTEARLFLAGSRPLVDGLLKNLGNKNVIRTPVAHSFNEVMAGEICSRVRHLLKEEAKKTLERALLEFHFAEDLHLAKKNIFQIAKAAVQGRIRKLIIADGINVFGKVDRKTGRVSIHPFDLDHEDDDILDDIAQAVLKSGGEVVVASREEIPKGRPILAILDDQGSGMNQMLEPYNQITK